MNLNRSIRIFSITGMVIAMSTLSSCKKEGCMDETANNYNENAKKDDGSCDYSPIEDNIDQYVPETYNFKDDNGNNTVSYGGQTDRLNQLAEMTTYMKSGIDITLNTSILNAMFENTGDNGGGNFSFSSTKQLKNKCFETDVAQYESYFSELVTASESNTETAASGQAGTLTSGTSTYLFAANGMEYAQIIEKGLMGAVFMYQATQVYFGDSKMNVNNTDAVDPTEGKYYTSMEHHWDEAFGYFGAPIDFPSNTEDAVFWAKYCNKQDANLQCNDAIMNAFLKGRTAIKYNFSSSIRDTQIEIIRKEWERFCASQAVSYFEGAKANFGTDNAKFLHELSEAYAFVMCLKYVPLETRVISYPEIESLLDDTIGNDFWNVTVSDLNSAISTVKTIYGLS